MRLSKVISVVDTHTEGEPTRVVVGGVPWIPGATMREKRRYVWDHLDYYRRLLCFEPRGHRPTVVVFLTPPVTPSAHSGVIFATANGYNDMCGHGTIGTVMTMVETGLVEVREPHTEIVLDTPAGPVSARAEIRDGTVQSVTFRNQPSFVWDCGLALNVPGTGRIRVDVAYGGAWYVLAEASDLGIELRPENLSNLLQQASVVRRAAKELLRLQHPMHDVPGVISGTILTGPPLDPRHTSKNIMITGEGRYDRSPCGTGTSARMAVLHAKGQLRVGQPFLHEGILGNAFHGQIVNETTVGDRQAIVPEITGTAFITGFNQIVVDQRDTLGDGFLLEEPEARRPPLTRI